MGSLRPWRSELASIPRLSKGSRIGKKRDFGVHLGANWRLKTSSFLRFSKTQSFIFKKLVASVVSKNNLFSFLLSSLSGRPFDFPPMPRLVPNPSREEQTIIGYHGRLVMSSEKQGSCSVST